MKTIKTLALALCMASSFSSFASIKVNLDHDIETMIINGEDVSKLISQVSRKELKNGTNQLVVRISKLIRDQGKFTKFLSEPMVVTFAAKDTELTISPAKSFDSIEQVGSYDKHPQVVLLNEKNEPIQFHLGYLERGGSLIRNVNSELVHYNSENNHRFGVVKAESSKTEIDNKIELSLGDTDQVEKIKFIYSELSESQRKAFLSWAIVQ
ncbi:DUF2057 family protein [Vibrio cortegadensis]|uniref:DUF2057 family protein n=1 Tax=Vibrio cortegadensis TaxID=1328770 RepID=UPI00352E08A5